MDIHQNTVRQHVIVFKIHWNAEEMIEKLNTSCSNQKNIVISSIISKY